MRIIIPITPKIILNSSGNSENKEYAIYPKAPIITIVQTMGKSQAGEVGQADIEGSLGGHPAITSIGNIINNVFLISFYPFGWGLFTASFV